MANTSSTTRPAVLTKCPVLGPWQWQSWVEQQQAAGTQVLAMSRWHTWHCRTGVAAADQRNYLMLGAVKSFPSSEMLINNRRKVWPFHKSTAVKSKITSLPFFPASPSTVPMTGQDKQDGYIMPSTTGWFLAAASWCAGRCTHPVAWTAQPWAKLTVIKGTSGHEPHFRIPDFNYLHRCTCLLSDTRAHWRREYCFREKKLF